MKLRADADLYVRGPVDALEAVHAQAQEAGLENIRVICHDVIEVLEYQLADNSLDEVCIFFPDPWPKKLRAKTPQGN